MNAWDIKRKAKERAARRAERRAEGIGGEDRGTSREKISRKEKGERYAEPSWCSRRRTPSRPGLKEERRIGERKEGGDGVDKMREGHTKYRRDKSKTVDTQRVRAE